MKAQYHLKTIRCLLNGSYVTRYHTYPTIGDQTVGQHSFNALAMLLTLHPEPPLYLIKAFIKHDMAEQKFGDLPSPTVKEYPELASFYEKAQNDYLISKFNVDLTKLSEEEFDWLFCLDKLEALFYGWRQLKMGNSYGDVIIQRVLKWLGERGQEGRVPQPIRELLAEIVYEIELKEDVKK